jgi:membrane-bound serine protease (ClpP class)
VRLRNKPVVTGQEEMIGALATADSDFAERGRVRLYGELWNAHARAPVRQGEQVRVTAIDGLTLEVEPTSIREN